MPLVSLDEAVLDPDIGSCFQVVRQDTGTGTYIAGAFQPGPTQTLNFFGIVAIATPQALEQVPEGDRVAGSIQVICNQQLYETLESREATSDVIQWGGDTWRVQNVARWGSFGFWSAICVRKKGA